MEWKEVRLGDVCEIKHGFAYKGKYFSDTPTCDILVTPGNFTLSGGFKLDKPKYYNGPVEKDFILSKDDLIVTMTDLSKNIDTLGYSALVPEVKGLTFHHNQRIGLVENIANNVDKYFLYWIMRTPAYQSFIATHSSGTTVHHTSPKGIGNYVFRLPPLPDQRRIASILSSLDRKIELNNKINADLEEMAQAIFKNWFVDFEPFKDGKFVDSELGMIPEGWKVSQIADIPHILETGKRPKGGAVEKGIPSVGAEHVKGMCAYDYSKTKYITPDFAAKLKTGKIEGYELLIYKDGGKPGYFIPNFSIFGEGYPFRECFLNEHVFKLDFNRDKGFNIFCYFFFKTDVIMSYFNSQGAKAAIPGINKKDVENIYILSPENEAVKEFGKFALPLFEQVLKNAVENRTLSLLRDTLLPRLMSGEIEVPE